MFVLFVFIIIKSSINLVLISECPIIHIWQGLDYMSIRYRT